MLPKYVHITFMHYCNMLRFVNPIKKIFFPRSEVLDFAFTLVFFLAVLFFPFSSHPSSLMVFSPFRDLLQLKKINTEILILILKY